MSTTAAFSCWREDPRGPMDKPKGPFLFPLAVSKAFRYNPCITHADACFLPTGISAADKKEDINYDDR